VIKFVMCLRRHPDLTREQFQDYWLNKHAPLFKSFAETFRAKKYVQDHTLETPLNAALQESRGMRAPYDGVAVVWFESEEELMAAMSSEEGQRVSGVLLEDEANFVDHGGSTAFIAKEASIF
jgi:uncharacterized protein (TIGR02118 family)